jgi:hypothetical protein
MRTSVALSYANQTLLLVSAPMASGGAPGMAPVETPQSTDGHRPAIRRSRALGCDREWINGAPE